MSIEPKSCSVCGSKYLGNNVVLETELGLATYKTSALATVLALWSQPLGSFPEKQDTLRVAQQI